MLFANFMFRFVPLLGVFPVAQALPVVSILFWGGFQYVKYGIIAPDDYFPL